MYDLKKPDEERQKKQPKKKRKLFSRRDPAYQIDRVKLSEKWYHFWFLRDVKKFRYQFLGVFILSIFFAFFGMIFVQNTGLYGFGIDAISHGISRLAGSAVVFKGGTEKEARTTFNILFWSINFIINVPLFMIASSKINKNFALLTMLFMIFSTIFGIGFSSIPNSHNWLLMGNPLNNEFHEATERIVQVTTWTHQNDGNKHVSIILYGLLWAVIQGIIAASLLMLNSSRGGFEILIVLRSRNKYKNFGRAFIFANFLSLLFANAIGTYVPASWALLKDYPVAGFEAAQAWNIDLLFNANFVSSTIMIIVNGFVIDVLFPKYKMVKLEVYTQKTDEILEKFYSLKDNRYAISINSLMGGYSKSEQQSLILNTFYSKASAAVDIITKIDPKAMICMYEIKKMVGHVFTSKRVNAEDSEDEDELEKESENK